MLESLLDGWPLRFHRRREEIVFDREEFRREMEVFHLKMVLSSDKFHE